MQDYGQPGGMAPPPPGGAPPPPPPKKKKGGKVLMIVGIILLILGLVMMVMLWPMVGVEKPEDVADKILKGDYKEGDSIKFVGEVEETADVGGEKMMTIKGFELEYPSVDPITGEITNEKIPFTLKNDIGASKGDSVVVEGKVGDDSYTISKVPTIGGILGIVLLIVGVILMIVGMIKGKKAKAAAPPPAPMGPPPGQMPPPPPQY